MKLYKELTEAIKEELKSIDETEEFSKRFYKIIENYFEGPCTEPEINEVIELITMEDISDGD